MDQPTTSLSSKKMSKKTIGIIAAVGVIAAVVIIVIIVGVAMSSSNDQQPSSSMMDDDGNIIDKIKNYLSGQDKSIFKSSAYQSPKKMIGNDGVPAGFNCDGSMCQPVYGVDTPYEYESFGDCLASGCMRKRYRCMDQGNGRSGLVADPNGNYYSKEDGIRAGCNFTDPPSAWLGSYVGFNNYYPDCSSGKCSGFDGVLSQQDYGQCSASSLNNEYGQEQITGPSSWTSAIISGAEYDSINVNPTPLGSCARGLDENVLVPDANNVGCDGFEGLLILPPQNLAYSDALGGDVTTLTNTKNQSYDLRGDIAVGVTNQCTEPDNDIAMNGPFCGTQIPDGVGNFDVTVGKYRSYLY